MEDRPETILYYYPHPKFKYIDIPRSGKEKRMERRKQELKRRKGRL